MGEQEIARYVQGVRGALADLPARQRDELLEDLPAHLAEVLAEGEGTLEQRLGAPEVYAAELRATADLHTGGPAVPLRVRIDAAVLESRRRLRLVDRKIGPMIGYAKASDFLRLLRPAWWVLRGYLLAMVLAYLVNDGAARTGLLPRINGHLLAAAILLAGCVIASVWFGMRPVELAGWRRRLANVGTAVLLLVAAGIFLNLDARTMSENYQQTYYGENPYENVQDIFVYDENGQLLQNVRLFDQNGRQLELGYAECVNGDVVEYPRAMPGIYPYCPENAPFRVPEIRPTVPDGESASPGVAPAPSSSPTVTVPPSEPAGPAPSALPSAVSSAIPSAVPSASG